MALPAVSMECRVAADPELRFGPTGMAVARIRTVASSRKKVGDEWQDDKTCWMDVTAFNKLAENVAESIVKGDLITVTGRLVTDEWTDRESGEKKSRTGVIADSVAASLAFRTVRHGEGKAERSAPASDPWGSAPSSDEPPF